MLNIDYNRQEIADHVRNCEMFTDRMSQECIDGMQLRQARSTLASMKIRLIHSNTTIYIMMIRINRLERLLKRAHLRRMPRRVLYTAQVPIGSVSIGYIAHPPKE